MLSYQEIIDYCSNYKMINGVVVDKRNNAQVNDENVILKVKSSILIYNEAKSNYMNRRRGDTKTQEDYIKLSMEQLSANNEVNSYGYNQLIRKILDSNGHLEIIQSGNDLVESKFSLFVAPKKDLGLSYLRLKFREKGLDIEDFTIRTEEIMTRSNKSTGQFNIIIDFKVKEYKKENSLPLQSNLFVHPKADELNDLERQKQIAKQEGDEVLYNYAQSSIEKIIRENQVTVTPEQWDAMSIDQQISFIQLKINESKVLHDKDAFDYWNTNLVSLKNKKNGGNIREYQSPLYNSSPVEQSHDIENKDYKYYYQEMMKAVQKRRDMSSLSEGEKKQIIGEIFYNQGYLIESLNTEKEFREVMTAVVNDLDQNELDVKLQNIILNDIQERYEKLNGKTQTVDSHNNKKTNDVKIEQSELKFFIDHLREQMNKVSQEYTEMSLDGLDDEELAILIKRIKELTDSAYSLKPLATTLKERSLLNSIIDMLDEEHVKMTKMQNGLEEFKNKYR